MFRQIAFSGLYGYPASMALSCLFSDIKYSIALGAGVPAFMCVLGMIETVKKGVTMAGETTKHLEIVAVGSKGVVEGGNKIAMACR